MARYFRWGPPEPIAEIECVRQDIPSWIRDPLAPTGAHQKTLPRIMPAVEMPLIFIICAVATPFTGRQLRALDASSEAMGAALPVLGILAGVGMFLQIMALTGGRGLMASMPVGLPLVLLYSKWPESPGLQPRDG